MLERELFEPEHRIFRDAARQFCKTEIAPFHAQWERDGVVINVGRGPMTRSRPSPVV